jgi:uncharacterized protein YdaU (DUF1376 family)
MPLYIATYLRKTMHLTRDQHGGYLLLIMACWDRGGRLPNDHAQLAGIVKASPAEWRKLAPVLLPFFEAEGDWLVQPRVLSEYAKAAQLSEIRRQAGLQGGRPKKQTETNEKAIGSQNHKLNETPARVRSLPLPKKEELKLSLIGGDAAFEIWWGLYPRRVGKIKARKAYHRACKVAAPDDLAEAVRRATWPADAKFIPHPATWLNEGRWMDGASDEPRRRVGFV